MEFKQLKGNRILLIMPEENKSKLTVDENTKEALQKEMLKKMSKLTVYAVGDMIKDINTGDELLIDPLALQKAPIIPIGDSNKLLVSYFDVVLVW